jgi:hypothetical protein
VSRSRVVIDATREALHPPARGPGQGGCASTSMRRSRCARQIKRGLAVFDANEQTCASMHFLERTRFDFIHGSPRTKEAPGDLRPARLSQSRFGHDPLCSEMRYGGHFPSGRPGLRQLLQSVCQLLRSGSDGRQNERPRSGVVGRFVSWLVWSVSSVGCSRRSPTCGNDGTTGQCPQLRSVGLHRCWSGRNSIACRR